MRRAAKLLIVYVLLAAFIAIGAGRVRMFPSYRLANSGENTVGIVTKLNPELHNSYTYEYTVNDRRYEKGTIAYPGVRIGDAVPVVYLPADPGVSDVGDVGTIAATFRHELELVAVAATVFPAFIVWRMWRSN